MPHGFAQPATPARASGAPPEPPGPYPPATPGGQTRPDPDVTLLSGTAWVLRFNGVVALIVGMTQASEPAAPLFGLAAGAALLGCAALIRRELERPTGRPCPPIPAQRRG